MKKKTIYNKQSKKQ